MSSARVFRDVCNEAGVEDRSAHGLRKFAATQHANHGATAHGLMAWFGWKSLGEAERYTRGADRRRLATEMRPAYFCCLLLVEGQTFGVAVAVAAPLAAH